MEKEFIIHIGFNKTGTTSIQNMLYTNAKWLLNHGIYYSRICKNHGRFLHSMFMDQPEKKPVNIKEGYNTHEKAIKLNQQFENTLNHDLKNPKITKVIFSGEALSTFSSHELKRFSKWLYSHTNKITIICCTRNPISWFNSQAQEGLKRRTRDINTICNALCSEKVDSAMKRLQNYASYFGKENILVYDFDKHKHRLYGKFLECCHIKQSISNKLQEKLTKKHNESLSLEAGLLLDQLNRLRPLPPGALFNYDESAYFSKIRGEKFTLPPELLGKVLHYNYESSKWLAENFKEECADYVDCNKILSKHKKNEAFSSDEPLESLALLISNLIDENKELIQHPRFTIKGNIKYLLAQVPSLRKIAQFIRKK